MRKVLPVLMVAGVALYAYHRAKSGPAAAPREDSAADPQRLVETQPAQLPDSPQFRCDGRTYCSQMHSCEEATFFLQNCPDVKMDGDHDGVPCERQWCE